MDMNKQQTPTTRTTHEPLYSVSEVARMLGIAAGTVVWHDNQGHVTARRCSGMRVFTLADVETIRARRAAHKPGRQPRKVTGEA